MLSIRLICVGKLKERYFAEAVAEYEKRLSAFCRLELIELPEERPPPRDIHPLHICGAGAPPSPVLSHVLLHPNIAFVTFHDRNEKSSRNL